MHLNVFAYNTVEQVSSECSALCKVVFWLYIAQFADKLEGMFQISFRHEGVGEQTDEQSTYRGIRVKVYIICISSSVTGAR
jgi:hypothetical protein